jgi:group I intron endonuclease
MTIGVYFIKAPSGKMYIGSAVRIGQRLHAHKIALADKTHRSERLAGAWAKYRGVGFEFGVLEECGREVLREREQYWVDLLKPAYNVRIDVRSNVGLKASKASRAKMSAARKAYLADPANREAIRQKTLKSWQNPEIATKRVAAMAGAMSVEGKAKIGAAAKKRDAMRKAQQRRWDDPDARRIQSEKLKAARARQKQEKSYASA